MSNYISHRLSQRSSTKFIQPYSYSRLELLLSAQQPHPPPLQYLLPLHIRRPSRIIIRRIRWQNLKLNRRVPLPVFTLLGSHSQIPLSRHILPRSYIQAINSPLKHLQRGKRLVERHFMTRFVDANERELAGLFDLPVYEGVARCQVRVAGA